MSKITLDNLSKNLKELISNPGMDEDQVGSLVEDALGSTNNDILETEDKTIIGAINELNAKVADTSNVVSKTDYDAKVAELEADIEEAFQRGNSVKQMLVDTLLAKGAVGVSTNDSFEVLISYISSMNIKPAVNPADGNVLVFTVTNGVTLELQNDLRGDTSGTAFSTDWGDGTINNSLTHTYDAAGVYRVTSKYNIIASDGTGDSTTINSLTSIIDLNENITNGAYMFKNCVNLTTVAEFDFQACIMTTMAHMFEGCVNLTTVNSKLWDPSEVTDMSYMFAGCSKLTTVITDTWALPKLENAEAMFEGCTLLANMESESSGEEVSLV